MSTLLERIVGLGGILNSLVSDWVVSPSRLQSQRERESLSLSIMLALRVSLRILLLVSLLSLSLSLSHTHTCIYYSVKFMRHFIRTLLSFCFSSAPSLNDHFWSFYNAILIFFFLLLLL